MTKYTCGDCGSDNVTLTKRARGSFAPGDHPWDGEQIFRCRDCGERDVV